MFISINWNEIFIGPLNKNLQLIKFYNLLHSKTSILEGTIVPIFADPPLISSVSVQLLLVFFF